MQEVNLGLYFLSEVVGTAMLILLGCGVVANVALAKTKGNAGGTLMVNWGWGLAVFAGVIVSAYSGAQLNPAVSIGLLVAGKIGFVQFLVAVAAQLVGAIIGAVLAWASYKQHFDDEPDPASKLGVFSTGPAIRSYGFNFLTEVIATFVLVFVIFGFSDYGVADIGVPGGIGGLPVRRPEALQSRFPIRPHVDARAPPDEGGPQEGQGVEGGEALDGTEAHRFWPVGRCFFFLAGVGAGVGEALSRMGLIRSSSLNTRGSLG